MDLHDLSDNLDVGVQPRLRRIWKALDRKLGLRFWFPHVPLFVAAAVLGLLELSPLAGRFLSLTQGNFLTTVQVIVDNGARRAPLAIAGGLLAIVSIGLLMRSRLAWVISLLLVVISLVLFVVGKAQPDYWALVAYNIVILLAMLSGYKYFRRSSFAAASLFAFASVLSVLAYAVVGAYALGPQFSPPITDIVTALYFSMVTMSTVGYGDIHPATSEAMLFAVSVIVLGITVFATSLSALLLPLINRRMEALMHIGGRGRMERANHYIIVGNSALALNSYKELLERSQKVTFVVEKPLDRVHGDPDVVLGDPSSAETLQKAGVTRANAVLALSDDDSDNAFVVLAVKDLAKGVKTVTAANDAANLTRLKRVHPDLIIAPQVLGGELLAMALTGEQLDGDKFLKNLLHRGQ